jgi:branched-chain amino acid transport system substrate-binding protein
MKALYQTIALFVGLSSTFNSQAEDLKIGTTLSLTGPYATYGRQALQGMQLAIDEINSQGGVSGRQVKLLVDDFGDFDLKRASTATRRFLDVEHVELFFPLIVEDSEVVVPITSKKPVFSMVVGCGARKCGFNLGGYNVRAPSSHDLIIKRLVDYAVNRNVTHSCIVAAESTYYGAYGDLIEELSNKAGQKVTHITVPYSNTEDFRSIATKFAQSKCDAIYSWIPIGATGGFLKRVRETHSKALVFSIVETDDPQILSTAGSAAEGVVFARFSLGDEKFQEKYEQKFHEKPSRPAIPSYDGVKLLLELASEVSTNPEALKGAIMKVRNRKSTNGTISYDSEGERLGEEVELMQIKNGKPVKLTD